MAVYKTTWQGSEENSARAFGRELPISRKTAIEIANQVRGKRVTNVINYLDRVLIQKAAIPYRRFTDGVGHKRGIGAGRYPYKASLAIKKLVESAVHNANEMGLDEPFVLRSIVVNQGASSFQGGRHRGRQSKSTHVEVIVQELTEAERKKDSSKRKSDAKSAKPAKAPSKVDEKKATPAPEKKVEPKKAEEKKPEPKKEVKPVETPKSSESKSNDKSPKEEKK